jgi:hypothetical protein
LLSQRNTAVIAEGTRKLLGNLFELEDLGAKDLKRIAGPVPAWVALRLASVEGRFEAFQASGLTDLVGREEEPDLLLRRWSKVLNAFDRGTVAGLRLAVDKKTVAADGSPDLCEPEHAVQEVGRSLRRRFHAERPTPPYKTECLLRPLAGQRKGAVTNRSRSMKIALAIGTVF